MKNNETKVKRLGIWMDHACAHIMEYTPESVSTTLIESEFTHQVKEDTIKKSESLMHNKEQHKQHEYYSKIGDVIRNYNEVVLFGPTDAKVELYNILKEDNLFDNVNIEVKQADKMYENKKHLFVREFFDKHTN